MKSRNMIRYCTTLPMAAAMFLCASAAHATTLRVVTYNVNLDTGFGGSGQLPDMEAVLNAIGQTNLNDNGTMHAQPFDVLALQELANTPTGSVSSSLPTLVSELNAVYGAGAYAYVPVADPVDGGTTGNGPSGLIYNTKTVQVINAISLGAVSGNGAPRAPMQYELHPVGYTSAADFYVDVSHTKSGTDSDSATRRNVEANTIVGNAQNTLPSNAHIVAVGDFNITSGSNEQTYKTLKTAFHDVGDPSGVWNDTDSASRKLIANLLSDSATDVRFRDDIQFVSPAADSNSGMPGLQYDLGSYMVFGNGGSTTLAGQSVNSASNVGVFPNLSAADRSALLFDLTESSDHLPVVADYDIVGLSSTTVPEPGSLAILAVGGMLALRKRRSPS